MASTHSSIESCSRCLDPDSVDLLVPTVPSPTWKNIERNVYGYSAHCSAVPGETALCSLVSVISLVTGEIDFSVFTCKLW